MCGRFTLIAKQEILERRFNATFEEPLIPRYNAAPDQNLPVIVNTERAAIKLFRWGIVPAWLAKLGGRKELINVKAETLAEKRTFARELSDRRCLVLADSFYEWQAVRGARRKQPYRIVLRSGEPFAFAGIWEEPRAADERPRFAIITTAPNAVVLPIHDRMPVILAKRVEDKWLDPKTPPEAAVRMLVPCPASSLRAYAVSTLVNRATVDSPAVIMAARSGS